MKVCGVPAQSGAMSAGAPWEKKSIVIRGGVTKLNLQDTLKKGREREGLLTQERGVMTAPRQAAQIVIQQFIVIQMVDGGCVFFFRGDVNLTFF